MDKNKVELNTRSRMKKIGFVFALCVGFCLTAAQAQTNALEALKSQFVAKRSAINEESRKKNQLIGQEYAADLKKVLQKVQKSGDFDGYVFVEKEIARFAETPTVGSPLESPLLKEPILAYQQKSHRINKESQVKHLTLNQQYLDSLVVLRKELMVQNKMKEASEANELVKQAESSIKYFKECLEGRAPRTSGAPPAEPTPTKLDSLFDEEPVTGKPSSENGVEVKPASTGKKSKKGPPEAVEFNGHFYLFYKDPMKWDIAKLKCQSRGGYLVTIGNQEENDFVASLIEGSSSVWIGFSKAGDTWRWVNLEKTGYTNWASGKPSIIKPSPRMGVGICAYIHAVDRYVRSSHVNGKYKPGYTEKSGEWVDAYGDLAVEGYLCEWSE